MTPAQLEEWRQDRARVAAQHPGPTVRSRGYHYRRKNNGIAYRTYRLIKRDVYSAPSSPPPWRQFDAASR